MLFLYTFSVNTIAYLKEIYGCGNPIFLKDIRIGRKSKTAIRAELSRGVKQGLIRRESQGIYFFEKEKSFFSGILFEDILKKRYIKGKHVMPEYEDIDVYGYLSGITFLHLIGLTNQFPMVLEITTNNTSSKKREIHLCGQRAILRKGRVEINYQNAKILQFLDMFGFLSKEEISENRTKINQYAEKNGLRGAIKEYLPFYGFETVRKIVEGGIEI